MKQVYSAAYLLLIIGLSACSPKLADVVPMEAVIAEAPIAPVTLPAPVVENKALEAGVCAPPASDGIGGTGCPMID